MNTRQVLTVGVAFLLGGLLGSLFLGQPTVAQQPAAQNPAGRYQLVVEKGASYVIDTTTGHCWHSPQPGDSWRDLGSPSEKKK